MYGSIILNLVTAVAAIAAVAAQVRKSTLRNVLRFFTALSNLYCALGCLADAACRLAGDAPRGVLVFRYTGTVSVTVTMLTVLFFLMPQYGAKAMFGGPDLWLHLLCPVMALVSHFAWDRPRMTFVCALLGLVPVILYGTLYLRRTVLDPPEKRWDDFYGFNRTGKWPVSFAAMIAATFAICIVLWALG